MCAALPPAAEGGPGRDGTGGYGHPLHSRTPMNPLALLRRLVLVKEGEVAALVWSAGYFFCILFAYYLISPFRDEMGMRQLENLRWLWTATTVATVVAAAGYSWLVSRLP